MSGLTNYSACQTRILKEIIDQMRHPCRHTTSADTADALKAYADKLESALNLR